MTRHRDGLSSNHSPATRCQSPTGGVVLHAFDPAQRFATCRHGGSITAPLVRQHRAKTNIRSRQSVTDVCNSGMLPLNRLIVILDQLRHAVFVRFSHLLSNSQRLTAHSATPEN